MADTITEPTVIPISPAVAEARRDGTVMSDDRARAAPEQKELTSGVIPEPNGDRGLHPGDPQEPNPQGPASASSFRIRDIRVGEPDGRGVPVTHVYAVQSEEYAIYNAGEVTVAFADDHEKSKEQRKLVLPLSSVRAELNALLPGLRCRELCEKQLAYALQLALDGDLDDAKSTVTAARAFVLGRRAAAGRFQYLKWSYGAAAVMLLMLFLADWLHRFDDPSSNLWLAGKAGLVGAAFSIALAIRGRTVALDTDLVDNLTDGTLRLLIGVISAGVLLLLLGCGILPSLTVGDAKFTGNGLTWQIVLVAGFVAGFLERLVPDLLERKNGQGNSGATAAGASTPV